MLSHASQFFAKTGILLGSMVEMIMDDHCEIKDCHF